MNITFNEKISAAIAEWERAAEWREKILAQARDAATKLQEKAVAVAVELLPSNWKSFEEFHFCIGNKILTIKCPDRKRYLEGECSLGNIEWRDET